MNISKFLEVHQKFEAHQKMTKDLSLRASEGDAEAAMSLLSNLSSPIDENELCKTALSLVRKYRDDNQVPENDCLKLQKQAKKIVLNFNKIPSAEKSSIEYLDKIKNYHQLTTKVLSSAVEELIMINSNLENKKLTTKKAKI